MARSQARLALADMLPQVGLQGGYGYMHGLKVGDETVLDGGSKFQIQVQHNNSVRLTLYE